MDDKSGLNLSIKELLIADENFFNSDINSHFQDSTSYSTVDINDNVKSSNYPDNEMEDTITNVRKLPTKFLDVGKRYACRVLDIHSPYEICIRFTMDEEAFCKMSQELQIHSKLLAPKRNFEDGSICAFQSSEKGWVRAQILGNTSSGEMEMYLVDYGSYEIGSVESLYVLSPKFFQLHSCCMAVHLADVINSDNLLNWIPSHCEKLKDILQRVDMKCDIEILEEDFRDTVPVKLFVSVDEELIPKGPLHPVEVQHISVSEMLSNRMDLPKGYNLIETQVSDKGLQWAAPLIPKEDLFKGIVTAIDWDGSVFISSEIAVDEKQLITKMLNFQFNETVSQEGTTSCWQKGDLCVVYYALEENWCRGEVLEVYDDISKCTVNFVDYGNVEDCNTSDMRKCLYMRDFPVQCFRGQLAVGPIGDKWEDEVLESMDDLLLEQTFHVCIVDRTHSDPKVKLVNNSGMDVSEIMIEKGLVQRLN